MSRKAFTLVEMLVVIAISAVFSALAITYSNVGKNVEALSIEQAKISQFILQAKQLSVATYTSGAARSCGYGVVFHFGSPQTYSIFAYSPIGVPTCPSVATATINLANPGIQNGEEQPYTLETWQVPVSQGVQLVDDSDSFVAVLFYPPEPTTFLSQDGTSFSSQPGTPLAIHLKTTDNKNSATLFVNSEGQVSTQ